MTFLTLLIVLLIERFWQSVAGLRRWGWLVHYNDWLASVMAKTPFNKRVANYFIVVISLLCLVLIIQRLLLPLAYYTWYYIFDFLVLAYCLGPKNFYQPFAAHPVLAADAVEEDRQMLDAAREHLDIYDEAVRANQCLFAPFFWFAVLGAFGVVLYRVTERLPRNEFVQAVLDVLDWIPARLLAVTFGLVSYFITVFPVWVKYLFYPPKDNAVLLMECVKSSLAEDQNSVHFLALIDRSLIIWLVVLALVVLI